ncbi:MAG: cobyric acid synthase [Firmicutes bacterium]|nr:cobyric acid synthase [Bacillota bacterium]
MGAVIMVQGTSSDAGKSIFCAALCRYFTEEGFSVAPFKAQNMALNAMAVPGGGEIGWAQVMQAEAAFATPTVEMNPILLKPISDIDVQVVVNGRVVQDMSAQAYQNYKRTAFPHVLAALESLRQRFDIVVIEGAGSPAEVNLRDHDIVNMRLAIAVKAPVLLISDIDRGGMFAYVAGTLALLNEEECQRIEGIVVNRFRGMRDRLQPGLDMLEEIIKKPVLGVIPHLDGLSLPAEDSLNLGNGRSQPWDMDIVVIRFPRISNFTDFHSLAEEQGVRVRYVTNKKELGQPHVIILPGTKNTIADLRWLKESGLAEAVLAADKNGCFVMGVCGGYQMLGHTITDLAGVDGVGGTEDGLALLPVETEFTYKKTTSRVTGKTLREGVPLEGYEIHLGHSHRLAAAPFAQLVDEQGRRYEDGACMDNGRVVGTYLHGLFDSALFRQGYLAQVRQTYHLPPLVQKQSLSAREKREHSYTMLAAAVRENMDTEFLRQCIAKQNCVKQ